MERVPKALTMVEDEYQDLVGRYHGGAVPTYRADDADAILITMGTATTTARSVVDELRAAGRKVGLAKLRLFRPFPDHEIRELARTADRIGVVDRSYTFGRMGPAATEVSAALYSAPHRPTLHELPRGDRRARRHAEGGPDDVRDPPLGSPGRDPLGRPRIGGAGRWLSSRSRPRS